MKRIFAVLGLLWVVALGAVAAPLTTEQNEVTQFIVKLYSYKPDVFEYGEFGGK